MCLLVIEDDIEFYGMLKLYLPGMAGTNVVNLHLATTLQQAETLIIQQMPEIILFDMELPDGNVFQRNPAWLSREDVERICMTGRRKELFYDSAIHAGIIAFVQKDENLFSGLEEALRKAVIRVNNRKQSAYYLEHLIEENTRIKAEIEAQKYALEQTRTDMQGKVLMNFLTDEQGISIETMIEFSVRNAGLIERVRVRAEDILLVEAHRYKTLIALRNGTTYNPSISIAALEEQLPTALFLRCHASYIVNIRAVRAYTATNITLETGELIPVSRSYKSRVREVLALFPPPPRKRKHDK